MPYALCDNRIPKKCIDALCNEGFEVITLPSVKSLPAALASHTDMLMFCGKGKIITAEEYRASNSDLFSRIERFLLGVKIEYTDDRFSSEYPCDAIFNALQIEELLFAKTDTCSKSLLGYAEELGLKVIPVKQGYPACTVLSFGRHAVTADPGLEKTLKENGISVTLISNTEKILLPPYSYGFIGGASGVYENKVYFLGNLYAHPDAKKIENAISEAGYKVISLDPDAESLLDLGGIKFFD